MRAAAYRGVSAINEILQGDVIDRLKDIQDQSINCIVTSPPYYALRDYGVDGQIGLEQTPDEYIDKMVEVFRECKRVLRNDGTLWVNIGDSYAAGGMGGHRKSGTFHGHNGDRGKAPGKKAPQGLKSKDMLGIPWMLAFALRADGWYLRQDIIWSKPNPMPESVTDRCTKSHEYIFLLSKSKKYYYDIESTLEPCSPNTHARLSQAVRDQIGSARANGKTRVDRPMKAVGRCYDPSRSNKNNASFDAAMAMMPTKRNKRSVWTVTTKGFKDAHFATFPPALIEPCILAGCPSGGMVLDPFMGAGTTAIVAEKNERNWLGIELNPEYIKIANKRIEEERKKGKQISMF